MAFDMAGAVHEAEVNEVFEHEDNPLFRVLLEDGSAINCTPNHWFLRTDNSFGEIGDFEVGHCLVTEEGHQLKIVGVETLDHGIVYNLSVARHKTFIADGLRVHNKGGGKGGAGGTTFTPQEDPNTLQAKNVARVVDLISEGEIVGLENNLKDVFLDNTPIQNADGSLNFSGVVVQERRGLPDQDPLIGFDEVETEVNVNVKVQNIAPVVRTISDPTLDALRVKIQLSSLIKQETDGDLRGTSVMFRIEVRPNGGAYAVPVGYSGDITIQGKTTSTYQRAFRVRLPVGGAPWNVKVTRITQDNEGDSTVRDEIFWTSYTEIIEERVMYMDSAVIGIEIDAQQFGNQAPQRSYLIKGRIIQVPSNYDPATRVYTGVWDGTFKLAWTDNPAWCVYDMVTNTRYGLGRDVPPAFADKWAMYTIGQYCDALVDDGAGGTEPRFTMNAVIQTREEAFNLLAIMASVFRGNLFWASGAVTAIQDSPTDVTRVVSQANVVDGLFDYKGSPLRARHSVVRVSWNNPALNYGPDIEMVEDPVTMERFGIRDVDLAAFGTTSRGQAHRFGKWLLDTERYGAAIVTYRPKADHEDAMPGEVVAINDPTVAGVSNGGRIVSATTTVLTVDRSITLTAGETYTVSVVLPDGSVESQVLTNAPGSYTALTLTAALTTSPSKEAMWVLSATNVVTTKWRIVANSEGEDGLRQITAVLYDASKYARIESNLSFETVATSILPSGTLAKITNLKFEEHLYQEGQQLLPGGILTWTPADDIRVQRYVVEKRITSYDSEWETVGETRTSDLAFKPLLEGESYRFRVKPAGFGKGLYVETLDFTILGLTARPADVLDFTMSSIDNVAYFRWTANTELDLSHYEIRFSGVMSGATWGASVPVLAHVMSASASFPLQIGTYLIKAVDTSGLKSANATLITATTMQLVGLNVVSVITEDPLFSGSKADVEVVSGFLVLVVNKLTGVYNFTNTFNLGEVQTSRVAPSVKVSGADGGNLVSSWPLISLLSSLSGTDPDEYSILLEIRTTQTDPTGSPVWTAWGELLAGDYMFWGAQFRVTLNTQRADVTPQVEQLRITIDMPDRLASANNVTAASGGTAVSYSPAFRATPALVVTPMTLDEQEYFTITLHTKTGFTIQFFNALDVGIAKNFSWLSKGYGVGG